MNDHYDAKKLSTVPYPEWMYCEEKIEVYLDGYRKFKALQTSIELGLFDILEQPLDPEEMASKIKTDPDMTRALCSCLKSAGLLEEKDGKFSRTREADLYYAQSSPLCQNMNVIRTASRVSRWDHLTERMRDGPEMVDEDKLFGEEWIRAISIDAKAGHIGRVIRYMEEHLRSCDSGTMIDVGGGHGLYTIAMCARHPGIKGRIFDREKMLMVAKEYSEKYGVHVDLCRGDLYENQIPEGNDIILISFNPGCSDPTLVPNINAALNPGGTLVVRRHTDDVLSDPFRNLEWNLKTWEGRKKGSKKSSSDDNGEYIKELSKLGVVLISRDQIEIDSEILIFEKKAR